MTIARVITCSDGASTGHREDRSGIAVRELLEQNGYTVDRNVIVPDEIDQISAAITATATEGVRLIVTTGGTGIARRDVTPEATQKIADRIIPGFGELMRSVSLQKTKMAPLSRAQAATLGAALIVNLPGSPNGATECLQAILHLIPHALELLGSPRVEQHP